MFARRLAGFLLLTTLVAGCATANAVDPGAVDDGTLSGMYDAGPDTSADLDQYTSASTDPYASSTPGPYGSPGASPEPTPTPTPEPVYSLPEAQSLQVARSATKTSGFWLWQKCTATVVVENPTRGILSGQVVITFTRGGAAVETVTDFVQDLEPGSTKSFTVKSTKRADDADVVVDTDAK